MLTVKFTGDKNENSCHALSKQPHAVAPSLSSIYFGYGSKHRNPMQRQGEGWSHEASVRKPCYGKNGSPAVSFLWGLLCGTSPDYGLCIGSEVTENRVQDIAVYLYETGNS